MKLERNMPEPHFFEPGDEAIINKEGFKPFVGEITKVDYNRRTPLLWFTRSHTINGHVAVSFGCAEAYKCKPVTDDL